MASSMITTIVPSASPAPLSPSPSSSSSSSSLRAPSAYECSLSSSDIDLSLRDDLAASVQDYLMRIVDELQQLSKWTSTCDARLTTSETATRHTATNDRVPLLLMETELAFVRRDLQLASQDVFQRATTQLAHVQSSFRSEYDDQLAEMQRRFDDKLRVSTHKMLSMVESIQSETQTKVSLVETTIQQLTQQLASQETRLIEMETKVNASLPALSTAHARQLTEMSYSQKRLDHLESTLALQLTELQRSTSETLQTLRASQTQLATKLQVVRLEMQEQGDEVNRKVLQLHRFLSRLQPTNITHAITSGSMLSGATESSVDRAAVKVAVGATAIARAASGSSSSPSSSGDSFLYAKAALPQRSDTYKRPSSSSGRSNSSNSSSSGSSIPFPLALSGTVAFGGGTASLPSSKTEAPSGSGTSSAIMDPALHIQSSTLCQPMGREVESGDAAACVLGSWLNSSSSPRKSSLRAPSQTQMMAGSPVLRPQAPTPSTKQR